MSDSEFLLPVYHNKHSSSIMKFFRKNAFYKLNVSLPKIGWTSVSLSFISFSFCILWSIIYNFEEANATHCSVENFFPSISAAIGHFYPQIYVWNTSVIAQMIPRLKISTMYLHYYSSIIRDKYLRFCYAAWVLHVCELWALLGLSIITSTSNYNFHAFCFVSFLLSSMGYMGLACYLLKFKRKMSPIDMELTTLKWKLRCYMMNMICFVIAGYFFRRHNTYCEPRVYSVFALFEYGVVISNILFHLPVVWDFHDRTMTMSFTSRGLEISYDPPFKYVLQSIK